MFKIHTVHTCVVHLSIFYLQIYIHANQSISFIDKTTYSKVCVVTLLCEAVTIFKIRVPKTISKDKETLLSFTYCCSQEMVIKQVSKMVFFSNFEIIFFLNMICHYFTGGRTCMRKN